MIGLNGGQTVLLANHGRAALCDGGHRLRLHLKKILCSVAGIYVRSQEEGLRADQPNTLGSKVVRRWRVTTRWIGGNLSAVTEASDYFNNNSQRLLWKGLFFNIRVALFLPLPLPTRTCKCSGLYKDLPKFATA
jgi:hypothetical protein